MAEELLRNWAFWCAYGPIGPPVQTQAASAEGNYQSTEVFAGEEPLYQPDFLAGEKVENIVRTLPTIQRSVLKATYIQYPYHRHHSIAQRLKISTERYELQLKKARQAVAELYKKS
jgi:DNA-directed RNA polymerase specialized sigma24 family protein